MSLETCLERIAAALEKLAEGGPTQLQFEDGPAEAIAPEPVAEKEVTIEDVRAALVSLGRDKGVAVLQQFGAKKISDLAEEHYGKVVAAAGEQ